VRLAVPKTFVVLRTVVDPSSEVAKSTFAFCWQRLTPYKRVRRVEFADLPKTISGKIRRVDLRNAELQRSAASNVRNPNEWWEEDFPQLVRVPAAGRPQRLAC
jgi:acetyl-CoA synthetase